MKCNYSSVNEKDFPLISDTRVWLQGCVVAAFYWRRHLYQIFSSEEPDLHAAGAPASLRNTVNTNAKHNNGSSGGSS
jgi:hypothetical protein